MSKKIIREARKTIAQHMREILLEKNLDNVGFGDVYLLHECFDRAKMKWRSHPLTMCNAVLNALDYSNLFEKEYFHHYITGRDGITRKYWLRVYILKEKEKE